MSTKHLLFLIPVLFLSVLCRADYIEDQGAKLKSEKPADRIAAIDALASMAGDHRAVPYLLEALKDSDDAVRIKAIDVLAYFRRTEVLDELVKYVTDKNKDIRNMTLQSLSYYQNPAAVKAAILALKDTEQDVRINAIRTLVKLDAKQSVPDVLALLKDPDDKVKQEAIIFVAEMGTSKNIRDLTNVKYGKEPLDVCIAYAMIRLGVKDKTVYTKLIEKALDSKNEEAKLRAIEALGKIGNEKHLETLKKLAENKIFDVRNTAISAVEQLTKKLEKEKEVKGKQPDKTETKPAPKEPAVKPAPQKKQ